MLAQAQAHAAEARVELDLREGDIRELQMEEPAPLIYYPGRSLLHGGTGSLWWASLSRHPDDRADA